MTEGRVVEGPNGRDLFGAPAPIPTLSLWEPWASLIAAGFKAHETRHWPTRVRGRIAIHAAKRVELADAPEPLASFALGQGWAKTRPVGCVVAVARLVACHRTEDVAERVRRADYEAGNFEPGRFAFELRCVRPLLAPLPLVGRQGFFSWSPPADLEARLGEPGDHDACAALYDREFGA